MRRRASKHGMWGPVAVDSAMQVILSTSGPDHQGRDKSSCTRSLHKGAALHSAHAARA